MPRIVRMQDTQKDRLYQRIWGGIGWPGHKPGFITIAAEESDFDPDSAIYILHEYENKSLSQLFKKAVEMTRDFCVSDWYGRVNDRKTMAFLNTWNSKQIDKHRATFYLTSAPHSESDNISYGIQVLLDKLKTGANKLVFFKESTLDGRLQMVNKTHDAKDTEYPAIAALGYVVSALNLYPYRWEGTNQTVKAYTEYNVLDR